MSCGYDHEAEEKKTLRNLLMWVVLLLLFLLPALIAVIALGFFGSV
jgi:hypothetical protein